MYKRQLLKRGIYGIHIIGAAAQHIAERIAVKIGQGQTADFLVHCHTQIMHAILVKQGSFQGLVGELIEMRGKYKIAIRIEYFRCV